MTKKRITAAELMAKRDGDPEFTAAREGEEIERPATRGGVSPRGTFIS
jgi:hypothetical protein